MTTVVSHAEFNACLEAAGTKLVVVYFKKVHVRQNEKVSLNLWDQQFATLANMYEHTVFMASVDIYTNKETADEAGIYELNVPTFIFYKNKLKVHHFELPNNVDDYYQLM